MEEAPEYPWLQIIAVRMIGITVVVAYACITFCFWRSAYIVRRWRIRSYVGPIIFISNLVVHTSLSGVIDYRWIMY